MPQPSHRWQNARYKAGVSLQMLKPKLNKILYLTMI